MAKHERQELEGSSEGLTFGKPKRDRSWDKEHGDQVASYRIPGEIKAEIQAIAADLQVSPADVAGRFLEFAIREYREGRLKLTPKPSKFTLA